jgi:hypothetical protein
METNPSNEAQLTAPTGSASKDRDAVKNLVAATFLAPPSEAELAASAGKETMADKIIPSNQEEAEKLQQAKDDAKALSKVTPDTEELPDGPKDEKKEEPKADEPKANVTDEATINPDVEQTDEEIAKDAEKKVKNKHDARQVYIENRKLEKAAKEKEKKLAETEKKAAELEAKIAALGANPDAEKLKALEGQLSEYQAKEEYLNKELARIDELQAANDVQNSKPYIDQVSKPLAELSSQLLELAAVVSEDASEQTEFAQRFNSVLQITDSVQRRRALESVLAPLTDYQRSEAIQIANDYKKAINVHTTLMSNAKEAQKMLQQKAEIQQREQMKNIGKEYSNTAQEWRQELAKQIPFLANPPNDEWKGHIAKARSTADGVDFSKVTPAQFARINETAHTLPIVLEAAKVQMAAYEKQLAEAKTQLTEKDKAIKDLEAKVGEVAAKKSAADSTRPRATDGTFANTTPAKPVTAKSWAESMLAAP